ncbi:MAG: hypothetical protein QOF48_1472 [Verrucomicrobiota bacterium]|jgi:hypothetical protein
MNHPTPEEWMSFAYGEDSEQHHRQLSVHLRECVDCAARMKTLRAGMATLDEWTLPSARAPRPRPIFHWAAAAALMLAVGIGLGRFSARDSNATHASFQQELDAKLEANRAEMQQLVVAHIQDLQKKQNADLSAFLVALKQADSRREAETARLRRDLDTVAVFADARLSQTQEQLYQLAASAQPVASTPINDH